MGIFDSIGDFQWREAGLLFSFFILVNSSAFSKSVLSYFKGSIKLGVITSYGIILQGLFMIIAWGVIKNILDDSDDSGLILTD
jgi:hypothetical protein